MGLETCVGSVRKQSENGRPWDSLGYHFDESVADSLILGYGQISGGIFLKEFVRLIQLIPK